MQVAEVLSDLTSLRVCGHSQALALVNVHHNITDPSTSKAGTSTATRLDVRQDKPAKDTQNPDLKRANELVELHYDVKAKNSLGQNWVVDEDLQRARADVNCVLQDLETHRKC